MCAIMRSVEDLGGLLELSEVLPLPNGNHKFHVLIYLPKALFYFNPINDSLSNRELDYV